jgi:hypothetical protein
MNLRPELFHMISLTLKNALADKKIGSILKPFVPVKIRLHAGHLRVYKQICILHLNKHFTIDEFAMYVLIEEIYNEKVVENPYKWELDQISRVSKVLGEEALRKDQEFIIQLSKKANLKSIEDFFTINSDGGCIAFDLMKKKYISPTFIVKYKKYIKDNSEESLETKRVRRIIETIEKQNG